jgi:hypothetical protein
MMESFFMKVITVSVSKHSNGDRSYAHDVWELLGENDNHWFLKCLTKSHWSEKPVVLLEKQYYDVFDVLLSVPRWQRHRHSCLCHKNREARIQEAR